MPTYLLDYVVYTYTAGPGNTASATGFLAGITSANISSTISPGDGNTYSVTSVGESAFASCATLTSTTIPNSVITIGQYAYENTPLLNSVSIGNSVTSVGRGAFFQCIALTSIILPNSITNIVDNQFNGCTSLASVTLPTNAGYTGISFRMFYGCSSLSSIIIPSPVTSIGNDAFFACSNLNLVSFLQTPTLPTFGSNAFTGIRTPSLAKYYSTVTNTTPISSRFTSISTLPVITSITPFTSRSNSAIVAVSYANLVTNGNEVVSNPPFVFLVNAVLIGSLSIGATQEAATPWNATSNKTIDSSNNAYWTPVGSGLINAFSVVIQDSQGGISSPSVNVQVDVPRYPCFLEGSKILCFKNNKEVYCEIENLRKGDLVKTINNGYLPIIMIGTTSLYNPGNDYRVVNRLYKCSREKYPTLFEDLYITGCHSILVPRMTDAQWENTKAVNGDVFVTDNHFRLIACADEKAEPFNQDGFVNIYHIALKNRDIYMNYGIYANGLLVESCSERNLRCLSNMRILGEEDCSIFKNIHIDGGSVSNNMSRKLVDTY